MEKTTVFFRLGRMYAPFAKVASVIFALLLAVQVISLAFPYLQGKLIDNLASKAPLMDSILVGVGMMFLYALSMALSYLRDRYELKRFDFEFGKYIELTTLERLFRFSLGQHVNENSGLRLSVVRKGQTALSEFMYNVIYSALPFILQIVLASAALLVVNPILGLVVVGLGGTYLVLLFRYNVRFYPKLKGNRDRWNKQQKYQSEIFRNIKTVKLSAREDEVLADYGVSFDKVAAPSRALWLPYYNVWYRGSALLQFGQVAAIMVGVILVHRGVESPGTIVMLIGWMGSVFGHIGNLGWLQRNLMKNLADINKYDEMLSREPAVKDADRPIVAERIEGRIEFDNVSFRYPKIASMEEDGGEEDEKEERDEEVSKEILQNVSFVIEPGETAAIVGHSGAGKTTVFTLLQRGYDPEGGSIRIDGTDLRQIQQVSYRSRIGYVAQQVELFDNTLRYNLLFGTKRAVSEEELEEVARKARIDQFYDRLGKKRFDALIGENGVKLSGGERQRVGIAQALLKKPDILIFDEATSSLDAENEALIQGVMREALEGRTGIIIAHRLSTIMDADKIIVLDKGRVVGIGSHRSLLDDCPAYHRLVKRQVVTL